MQKKNFSHVCDSQKWKPSKLGKLTVYRSEKETTTNRFAFSFAERE